ncbi:MAG: TerB family tellurite resistance protein [Myxococcota bacterium]
MPFDDSPLDRSGLAPELALAFQLHVADLVTSADLATTDNEQAAFDRNFPRETLLAAGFVDPDGARTPRLYDAAVEALATLPARLTVDQKLTLLDACWRIAVADRALRLGEGAVLLMAARLLGLSDAEFDGFLGGYPEAEGLSAAVLDRED